MSSLQQYKLIIYKRDWSKVIEFFGFIMVCDLFIFLYVKPLS